MSAIEDFEFADGRTRQVHRAGSEEAGARVLVMHYGTPHTGRHPGAITQLAEEFGLSLVSVTRPGFPGADRQPGRTVADVALDVVAVLDHLGIERACTAGYSGGGPHALALAALLPDRVSDVAVFGCPAPYDGSLAWFAGMAGNGGGLRAAAQGSHARVAYQVNSEFDPAVFTGADLAALQTRWAGIGADAQAAGALGSDAGEIDDDLAFVTPWGVDLDRIAARVTIVQAADDHLIPAHHATRLAELVPAADLLVVEGSGHVAILDELVGWLRSLAHSLPGLTAGSMNPLPESERLRTSGDTVSTDEENTFYPPDSVRSGRSDRSSTSIRTTDGHEPSDVIICRNCGVESDDTPPDICPICADERQWVPESGQEWVGRSTLESEGHHLVIEEREPGLHALRVEPRLGIGQTCYLAETEHGNLLFDVPPYIDAEAIEAIRELGGVAAIVPSHPHMFGMQLEWSAAFDDAPVFICDADAEWVQRDGHALVGYADEATPLRDVDVHRVGGHFPGSAVALWRGRDGTGVMLAGDSIGPVARTGWVTFLRSFPNYLPLSAAVVRRIAASVADLDFDRMYGNFGQTIPSGAYEAVQSSADRYAQWVSGEHDDLT